MLKFALGWTYSLGIINFSPYDIIIKEGNIGVMLILIFSAGG